MHMVRVGTASNMCHLSRARRAPLPLPCTPDPAGVFFVQAVQPHAREETLTFQLTEVEAPTSWMLYLISEHHFHAELKAEQPTIVSIS